MPQQQSSRASSSTLLTCPLLGSCVGACSRPTPKMSLAVYNRKYSKSILGLACSEYTSIEIPAAVTEEVDTSDSREEPQANTAAELHSHIGTPSHTGPAEPVKAKAADHPGNGPTPASDPKTVTSGSTSEGSRPHKVKDTARHAHGSSTGDGKPRVTLPANMEPTFYIGGGNGTAMIEETLLGLGYKRIKDKNDDTYKFKWCELKAAINYNTFKEGEQMVNHIPNCQLLTNKLGLVTSLQEYDRVCVMVKRKPSRLDFIPETLKLDDRNERETFFNNFKDGDLWICKPTGRNQGKGIFLARDLDELKQVIQDNQETNQNLRELNKPQKPLNRIIQRYINNPLLLEGKKFDIRAYMLIANTTPYLVLYHKGYVRLCMYEYETETLNLTAHLTNQFIQKKDPKYKEIKEETIWSMDRFNDYINNVVAPVKGLEEDWVYNTLTNRMKQIMTFCFTAVKHKLQCKTGYSDLYGLDFMVDENMKIWLIEVNVNPCLATNCESLRDVVPPMVKETIHITVECFEKSRRMRPLMPLAALKNFQILHNASPRAGPSNKPSHRSITATPSKASAGTGATDTSATPKKPVEHRSKSLSPVRRSRSLSPVKEAGDNAQSPPKMRTQGSTTHRHVLKATPTLLSPSQNVNRSQERPSGSLNGQPLRPLRDRTLGAYRPAVIRTITRDPKPNTSSPNPTKRSLPSRTPPNPKQNAKTVPGEKNQETTKVNSLESERSTCDQPVGASGSDTEERTPAIKKSTKGEVNSTVKLEKSPTSLGREKTLLQREPTTVTLKMTHGSTVHKPKPKVSSGKKDDGTNRGS